MNTGKLSEGIVEAFFKRQGKDAFLHRVTDQAEVYGMNRKKPLVAVKKQPADNVLTWKGITYWLEVKSSKNEPSFPFSNMTDVQLGSARKVVAAGGKYIFALHRLSKDKWYWVDAKALFDASEGKNSVRWDALNSYEWNPYA